MQKTYSTILLLFTCLFGFEMIAQNTVIFENITLAEAQKKSAEINKPIFLMVYATWCPHCKFMKNEVFPDEKTAQLLNENFICIEYDAETENGILIKNQFDIKAYPALLFLDKNGTVLYNLSGKYTVNEFVAEINSALNPKMQLPYLKAEFENDISNIDKCMAYILTLRKGKSRRDISPAAHQYLATQTDKQLLSEANWRVITNGVTDIDSYVFQYVLNNKSQFEKITSPVRVERKISNIATELLRPFVEQYDTTGYYKNRKTVEKINLRNTDSIIFNFDLEIAAHTQNWNLYQTSTLKFTDKFYGNDAFRLREISSNYLKFIQDEPALVKAIEWASRALELNDNYDNTFLLAQLYYKINDKANSLIYARKAKENRSLFGFDPKEADELLSKLE